MQLSLCMKRNELNLFSEQLDIVNWLFGLVAWFALRVREFPGSISEMAFVVVSLTSDACCGAARSNLFVSSTHVFQKRRIIAQIVMILETTKHA